MFIPEYFRVTDTSQLVGLIRGNSFGMMASVSGNGELDATHMPFLVDDRLSEMKGHMARANNQWKELDGKKVLVIFQGPNHYVSAEWYGEEMQVPTWNYAIVHVKGTFHVLPEEDKMGVLDEIVSYYENSHGGTWSADWDMKEYSSMLNGIVAFRISVDSVEGKWKLSQNHPDHGVLNAAREIEDLGDKYSSEIAGMMREAKGLADTENK